MSDLQNVFWFFLISWTFTKPEVIRHAGQLFWEIYLFLFLIFFFLFMMLLFCFIYLFIYLFICLFIYLFIYLFISFTYLFVYFQLLLQKMMYITLQWLTYKTNYCLFVCLFIYFSTLITKDDVDYHVMINLQDKSLKFKWWIVTYFSTLFWNWLWLYLPLWNTCDYPYNVKKRPKNKKKHKFNENII